MSNVMKPRKAAVIGCGFVGSATAFTLMQSKLFSELVLLDVNADKADGEAKDISHGIPFAAPMKVYAGDYDDVADAAVIIVTAGANQKPDESRLDLVHRNVEICRKHHPQDRIPGISRAFFSSVPNPVDILTYAALKFSGLPENLRDRLRHGAGHGTDEICPGGASAGGQPQRAFLYCRGTR